MEDRKGAYCVLAAAVDHVEDLAADGRLTATWIQKEQAGQGLDLSGSKQEQVAGSCERGNYDAGNFLTSKGTIRFSRTLLHEFNLFDTEEPSHAICTHLQATQQRIPKILSS